MVKTINLAVKADPADLQHLEKISKDLSNSFLAINKNLKDIGDSIEKVAQRINRTSNAVRSSNLSLTSMVNSASKLNRHFAKLGGMIGGIVMMLGGGAWLGMDKIAQRMVDTRRRLLGLGGADYGKTQAVQTYGKGLLDDPNAFLKNIQKAKSDYTSDQYRALKAKGFTDQEIKSMSDPDLGMEYLRRTSKKKMEGPGVMPVYGKGQYEQSMFGEQDIIRLHGRQGQGLVEMMDKHFQATKGLTDKDLQIWEKFWESVNTFKIKLDTEWIKALEPLAPAGSKLIEAITKLTTSFLEWDKVTTSMQQIAAGMDWLADFLSSDDWHQAWHKLEKGLADLFSEQKTAAEQTQQSVMDWLREHFGLDAVDKFFGYPTPPAGSTGVTTVPMSQGPAPVTTTIQNMYNKASRFLKGSIVGPTTTTTSPSTASPSSTASPQTMPSQTPVPLYPNPFSAGSTGPGLGSIGGFTPSAVGGPSGGGGVKLSSAVQGMTPRGGGSAISSISSSVLAALHTGGGKGPGDGGPLDVKNWQSTRTASLVVRGVPSANMFLSSTGMVG